MRPRDVAVGFAAGALLAGFGHREALGRQGLYYARNARCLRRRSPGGVAAIGDSITIGVSRPDWGLLGGDSWLTHAIVDGRLPYCVNAALANQSTEWIAARLGRDALAWKPDVVVVLAGTNDVLHGFPVSQPMRLLRQMTTEIRTASAVPVLATLPPYAADPDRLEEFNGAVRALAAADGALLIDFHPVVADGDHYRAGTTDDGLHPNTSAAREMGAAAIPVLREALADAARIRVAAEQS